MGEIPWEEAKAAVKRFRSNMKAEELLLHLTREAALCDHIGDMSNSLIDAFELLGMDPPEVDDDGDFDIGALEARGARSLYDILKGKKVI